MILLLLKRMNIQLDRDVIFLAEAGEEGTSTYGVDYMVKEHWAEIEAEYAIAEGGSIVEEKGKPHHVLISNTEKSPQRIRLVAHGPAGHGSRPEVANAVVHLAEAVARAGKWQTPVRLNETTRTYFERLAAISPPQSAERYRDILNPARAAAVDAYFRESEPGHYSILRTSVVPTIINIGFRSNVIPSEGEAMLDVRALPDEDMPAFIDTLKRLVDDPAVEVLPLPGAQARPVTPPSRLDTEMFKALETAQKRRFPTAITLPLMVTGATDSAQLRAKGVQAYGLSLPATEEDNRRVHGNDERLRLDGLEPFVAMVYDAVVEVAGTGAASR
jgi:acetylornithine deacetylase/succinyl-diaminopimelate desuccinylase-like protein